MAQDVLHEEVEEQEDAAVVPGQHPMPPGEAQPPPDIPPRAAPPAAIPAPAAADDLDDLPLDELGFEVLGDESEVLGAPRSTT